MQTDNSVQCAISVSHQQSCKTSSQGRPTPRCATSQIYIDTVYRVGLQYTLRSNSHADRLQRGVHSRAAAENGHGGRFPVAIATAAMQITLPSLLVMVALLINLQVSVNLILSCSGTLCTVLLFSGFGH